MNKKIWKEITLENNEELELQAFSNFLDIIELENLNDITDETIRSYLHISLLTSAENVVKKYLSEYLNNKVSIIQKQLKVEIAPLVRLNFVSLLDFNAQNLFKLHPVNIHLSKTKELISTIDFLKNNLDKKTRKLFQDELQKSFFKSIDDLLILYKAFAKPLHNKSQDYLFEILTKSDYDFFKKSFGVINLTLVGYIRKKQRFHKARRAT